jgi:hypothetical protein
LEYPYTVEKDAVGINNKSSLASQPKRVQRSVPKHSIVRSAGISHFRSTGTLFLPSDERTLRFGVV